MRGPRRVDAPREAVAARPGRPLATGLVFSGILGRLIPHPPNFAPVGAASVYAGARLTGWQAFVVPVVIMIVSDPLLALMLGYRAFGLTSVFVYTGFLLNVALGRTLREAEKPAPIAGVMLIASLQFFLISNLGLWLSDQSLYPKTLAGLGLCYQAAVPYLGRTIAADLIFGGLLFGLHAVLSRARFPAERVG